MRERVEDAFEAWAGFVSRWPYAIVVAGLVAAGLCISQIGGVTLDTSTESYLLEDDPVRAAYDDLRIQFGRDQILMIALEPENVFDLEFLRYLRELHDALEEGVPSLERITSLVNVRSVYGRGDELVVGDLLEELPEDEAGLLALRERVLATPSYLDGVISRDGRLTVILLETDAYSSIGEEFDALSQFDEMDDLATFDELDPDGEPGEPSPPREFLTAGENSALVEAAKAIVEDHRRADIPIYVSGSTALTHEVSNAMQREIPYFFGGSLTVIAAALFLLFRRFTPCVIALTVVTLSVAATFGTAGALGQTLSILSQILPSFLLSVGVGYSVHLLAIYFQRLAAGDEHFAALVGALRHSGPPIVMTALTTAVGLASFLAAAMPPIRSFGAMAMVGVGWALLFNLTLLPALLCIVRTRGPRQSSAAPAGNRLLMSIGMGSARHPWKIVAGASLLAVSALWSAFSIQPSNDPIKYLDPEAPFRVAFEYLDERLSSSMSLELFIDARERNALHRPEVMNALDRVGDYAAAFEFEGRRLGRTTSIVDIAKETHQALNANSAEFYAVPQDRKLLAQELLLFENSGSDDILRVVDSEFRRARYSIGMRFEDGNEMARVSAKVQDEITAVLGPEIDVVVTGAATLIGRTVSATTESLGRTYALAFLLITPLMMLLIGSLRSGLVSMAPNLLPILLTLGLMPLVSVPLDLFTMMVGCISIGLAVDDTLHFIHGFRSRLSVTQDPYRAIEQTLQTTGRALLFTSIVLSAGFLVFTFSSMANLRSLGVLTAFSISAAFILDIIVTPALLILVTRGRYASTDR